MYLILWEFQVKANHIAEFEKIYAVDGAWAELFKKGQGFMGTELLHSSEHPLAYITIDRWVSVKDYESFLSQWKDEYGKLDAQCEGLTERESCLGKFETGFNRKS